MATIASLVVALGADPGGVRRGLEDAAQQFNKFADQAGQRLSRIELFPDLTPAGRTAAQQLINGLLANFEGQQAVLQKRLEDGILTPGEFHILGDAAGKQFQEGIEQGLADLRAHDIISDQAGAEIIALLRSTGEKAGEAMRKAIETKIRNVGEGMENVGRGLTKAVTIPLTAIAVGAVAASEKIDDAFDVIRAQTGATGPVLAQLQADFRATFAAVPASVEDTGDAIAGLNRRLGLVGAPLQALATQVLELARLTKSDLNEVVTGSATVFRSWSISMADAGQALDFLFRVSQQTGVPFAALLQNLQEFGPALRNMGLGFDESAVLLGQLTREGVSVERTLAALRVALVNFAKAGIDAPTGLRELIRQIQQAATDADAINLASHIFGARAGAEMAVAIREGRLAIDDLLQSIRQSPETVETASAAVRGFGEAMDELKRRTILALEPLGASLTAAFENALPAIQSVIDVVGRIAAGFARLPAPLQRFIIVVAGIAAALGPVLVAVGAIVSGLATFASGLLAATAAGTTFGAVIAGALLPVIGWGAAIVAVVAGIVAFRDELAAAGRAVVRFLSPVIDVMQKIGAIFATVILGGIVLYLQEWARVARSVASAVVTAFTFLRDKVEVVVERTAEFIRSILPLAMRVLQRTIESNPLLRAFVAAFGAIIDFIQGLIPKFVEVGRAIVASIIRGLAELARKIPAVGEALAREIESIGTDAKGPAVKAGADAVQGIANGIRAGTRDVESAAADAAKAAGRGVATVQPPPITIDFETEAARKQLQQFENSVQALLKARAQATEQGQGIVPELDTRLLNAYAQATTMLREQRDQYGEIAVRIREIVEALRNTPAIFETLRPAREIVPQMMRDIQRGLSEPLRVNITPQISEDRLRKTLTATVEFSSASLDAAADAYQRAIQRANIAGIAGDPAAANAAMRDAETALARIRGEIEAVNAAIQAGELTGREIDAAYAGIQRSLSRANVPATALTKNANNTRSILRGSVGIVQALGDAFGGSAREVANIVSMVESLGDSIGNVVASFKGGFDFSAFAGGITSAIGALAGIGSAIFGESPAQREARGIVLQNNERLRELANALNGFDVNIQNMVKVFNVIGRTLSEDLLKALRGMQTIDVQSGIELLDQVLKGAGSSLAELEKIADEVGIQLFTSGGKIIPEAFAQLQKAIEDSAIKMTRFSNSLEDARRIADLQRDLSGADVTDPMAVLQRELKLLQDFAPELFKSFQGIDAATKEGRELLSRALNDLFQRIVNEQIPVGDFGLLGGLEDLLSIITNMDDALDSFRETVDDVNASMRNVPAGFKYQLANFEAQVARTTQALGTIPTSSIPERPTPPLTLPSTTTPPTRPTTGDGGIHFHAPVTIPIDATGVANGDELVEDFIDALRRKSREQFGVTNRVAELF